jgi:FkbM family methyltransferase
VIRQYSTLEMEPCPANGFVNRVTKKIFWNVLDRLIKGKKLKVRLFSGDPFLVRVGDQISRGIFYQGCHEPQLTSLLLPFLGPGMTVFDVGANIGYYTVLMARRVGPTGMVHSFEINENVIDLLEENIRLAKVGNVKIARRAVARTSGPMEFFVPRAGDEAEGSLKKSQRYEAANTVKVSGVSLDEYIEENGIKRVNFIKIDVEGAEYEAFEGAKNLLSSNNKPVIMFEALDTACMNFGVNWLDVVEKVKSFGYRIHQADAANYFATPESSEEIGSVGSSETNCKTSRY